MNSVQFHDRLLEIARNYEKYGRVDDEYRWAPHLCRMPSPSVARFSASADAGTHGRKLYFLFAKDRNGYLRLERAADDDGQSSPKSEKPAPKSAPREPQGKTAANKAEASKLAKEAAVGQVIVKESWVPKEVEAAQARLLQERTATIVKPTKSDATNDVSGQDAMLPYARQEGKLYHASEKSALFIMVKLDPTTPDTDQGWVYGTVTADGKRVTSAGNVASCMACHREAPHDRLFGLNPSGPVLVPETKPASNR